MYSNSHTPIARTGATAIRAIARAAAVALALTFAAGCSLLSENLDKAAKGAGKVVTYYCENITIPEIREEVRAAVNKHAAPHAVAIQCADGEGPLLKSNDPASVATPENDDGESEGGGAGEPMAKASKPIVILEKWLKPIFFPERVARLPIVIVDRRKQA